MLRRTSTRCIWQYDVKPKRQWHTEHKYRELTKWQREASGLVDWQHKQSRLVHRSTQVRFNPNFAGLSKGVTAEETKKWTYVDQLHLPDLPPPGYKPPTPVGRSAWPSAWRENEDFALRILALTEAELREFTLETLTVVIHEEAQRDGIELRRLDMEGAPMTELPTEEVIAHYSIEEDTLRDRIIERSIEEPFGFVPDSVQRAKIRSTKDVIDFVAARIRVCRVEKDVVVTDAVLDFLAEQPMQPEFGFQHALPQDTREDLVKAWEHKFHWKWQFGNAEYSPRTTEEDQLTPTFIEAEAKIAARDEFDRQLEEGELRRQHLAKIEEAAAA
jgi:hypothetical protein